MKRREITSLLIGACILGSIVGAVPTVANATNVKNDISEAIVKDKVAIKNNSGKIVGYTNPYDGIDVKNSNKDMCNVTTQFGLKGNIEKKDLQFIKSDLNEKLEDMNEDGHVVNVTTGLNLREKATTNSDVIGTLENDTNLKITGRQGDWYKVAIDGKEGFVYSSFISEGTSKTETSKKSNDETVDSKKDLNDFYEDMKNTGNWNHVYNSGFTVGVSGFTVNSDEIKFLTDGSFTSSEEEEILKVFEKITPSAVDQIKDALDSGKNFSGIFDGLHISASFNKFGQITITNDGDSQQDNQEEVKSQDNQYNRENTKVENYQENKESAKSEDKQNTQVDNKKEDTKEVKPEDKQDAQTDVKVDNKQNTQENNKSNDEQNTKSEDKVNDKVSKTSIKTSLDQKKDVQSDEKLDIKQNDKLTKLDNKQNVQVSNQVNDKQDNQAEVK